MLIFKYIPFFPLSWQNIYQKIIEYDEIWKSKEKERFLW